MRFSLLVNMPKVCLTGFTLAQFKVNKKTSTRIIYSNGMFMVKNSVFLCLSDNLF